LKQSVKNYKRIVVKIGSSLFCADKGSLDFMALAQIVGQIGALVKGGKEVVVVSSGAIALGMHTLGLKARPKGLCELQAAAAVGQNEVIDKYCSFFKTLDIQVGQVLLTWDDFSMRQRYLNAKNTLIALLKYRVVPIVNENDTISTDEIKFGDNDRLSALVANLLSADLLVILSDVDGLLDREGNLIRLVDNVTPGIKSLACPTKKHTCVGGMVTKIEAAKICMDSGISCVIANGRTKDIIKLVAAEPEKNGTLFLPKDALSERERWIAFGTRSKGKIVVDDGAKKALLNRKSLLSVGIKGIEGSFDADSIVSIVDIAGFEFARGKTTLSGRQLDKVKGTRFDKEIIHCDNIVIL